MRFLPSRVVLIAIAPVALGGCSSLFDVGFTSYIPSERASVLPKHGHDTAALSSNATEAGRTLLTNRQPGLAIEAFQRALASGEPVAPALNGMGVAYARIGRTDLAVRYFRQAAATEPQNSQFTQNLDRASRLTNSTEAEQVRHTAQSPYVENPSARSIQSEAITLNNSRRPSRSEIRIVTRADPSPAGHDRVSLASRFQPLVRIEFARAPGAEVMQRRIDVAASFKPIVRINLEEARRLNLPNVQVALANSKPTK